MLQPGANGSGFHGINHHGLRLPGTWGGEESHCTRKAAVLVEATVPSHTLRAQPGSQQLSPFPTGPPGAPHPSRRGEGSRAARLGTALGFAVPGRGP